MQNPIELIERYPSSYLVYRTGLTEVKGIKIERTKEIEFICSNCSQFPKPCPKIGISKFTGTSSACDEFELCKREENALQG